MHLKLFPGIFFSHTNNKIMNLPKFDESVSLEFFNNSLIGGGGGSSSGSSSGLGGYGAGASAGFTSKSRYSENIVKYLKYRRSETEMDWNYPFDFCGSIYRYSSI